MKQLLVIFILVLTSIAAMAKPPHLAAEQLFDGRYNKEKTVRTSISRADGIYYRSLHITDNPGIIKIIENALRKDSPRAAKSFEQEGEGGRYTSLKIVSNGETIDIGLQQYNGNAFFFIKGKEKAFK